MDGNISIKASDAKIILDVAQNANARDKVFHGVTVEGSEHVDFAASALAAMGRVKTILGDKEGSDG